MVPVTKIQGSVIGADSRKPVSAGEHVPNEQ
jgi:hypothetical protein